MAKKEIKWEELGFSYIQTDSFVRVHCSNGVWGEPELLTDPMITIHVAATALHYGQTAFEGLKVFTMKDGSIAAFRPEENAHRMNSSARRLLMEEIPVALFDRSIELLVKNNLDYIPPYGTGASLYVRPLLIGSGARVGVQPSDEYDLYILGMPVGPYYKNGFSPVDACIQTDFDRAAPKGLGNVKAGGNYAAGLMGDKMSKERGFSISLYLDSAKHRYIDEFGTSNFIGITSDNSFVTPSSPSVLPSITNKSLQTLAEDMGYRVEKRQIEYTELDSFVEVGACGTAAVLTPIRSITYEDTVWEFGDGKSAGPVLTSLYKKLQGIQYGEYPDTHNWMRVYC